MLKVRTSHDYPPIPIRSVDWSAVIDGREEDGPYGRGPTELAAAISLLHELVAGDCGLDEFIAGLQKVMELELQEAKSDGRNPSYISGYQFAMSTAMGFV